MNGHGGRHTYLNAFAGGWPRVVLAILLLFMFLFNPGRVWAEPGDSPVQIKVDLGWQGKVVPGRYAPAVVTMKNTGNNDYSGTIEAVNYLAYMLPGQPGAAPGAKQPSKFFPTSAYGETVTLPAGAEKKITLWFPADGPGGRTDFVFKTGGKEIARISEKSKAAIVNGPMPGAVGVLGQVPPALERVRLTMSDGVPRSPMVIELSSQLIPRRGDELNAFKQILVTGKGALTLSDEQRAALVEWVKNGGQLVLSGGLEINESLKALPGKTVSVEVKQINPQTQWQPAAQWLGSGSAGAAAPAAILAGNGTAWGPNDRPLGMQFILGDGGITVLSFDPGQTPWQSGTLGTALWQKYLTPSDQNKYYDPYVNDYKLSSLAGNTTNMPVNAFPGWKPVGLYLLAFLVLAGPGVFLVLRRMKRPEYTWVAVPLLALVFSGGVYLYMLQSGGKVLVNVVQVLDNRDGINPSGYTSVGYFAPTAPEFNAVFKDPGKSVMVQPMGGPSPDMMSEEDDPPYSLIRGSNLAVRFSDASQWSMRAVAFRDDQAADVARGLSATVEIQGNKIIGKVTNQTGMKLDHATFFYGSDYKMVGDLQPGGEAAVEMSVSVPQYNPQGYQGPSYPSSWQVFMYPGGPPPQPKPGMPPEPPPKKRMTVEEQRRANLMENWMGNVVRRGPMEMGWPLTVLAWSDSPAGDPGLAGINRAPFYLTMFVLKPEIKLPAGSFNIPAGLVVPEVIDSQVRGMFGNNNLMGLDGGSLSFLFKPQFGSSVKLNEITVHLDYFPVQGSSKGMGPPSPKPAAVADGVLEIYHPGRGTWQTLSGSDTFKLPGDYALPGGEVTLRINGGDPNKGTGFYILPPTVAFGGEKA